MEERDLEIVRKLATELRAAIERTSFSTPPLDHYPKGCCGDAAIFLSEYLIENGFSARYYCGLYALAEEQREQSHAWVVLDDGIIADITGDQFKDKPEFQNYDKPVYVGVPDDFHKLFSFTENEHIGGIDYYDERSRSKLRSQYNRIIELL